MKSPEVYEQVSQLGELAELMEKHGLTDGFTLDFYVMEMTLVGFAHNPMHLLSVDDATGQQAVFKVYGLRKMLGPTDETPPVFAFVKRGDSFRLLTAVTDEEGYELIITAEIEKVKEK